MDDEVPSRVDVARFRLWSTVGGSATFPSSADTTTPDTHGQNMENGTLRNASQPQGKSDGRSVDEIVPRFLEGLSPPSQLTRSTHGMQGRAVEATAMVPVSGVQVLTRALEVEVYDATISRTYDPPRGVQGSVSGGTVTLTWVNPPTRYDTHKNEVWRGTNSGDPAPTTRAGTQIAVGTSLATTTTDTPGAGTWNYSLFHVYSEVSTDDRASDASPANTVTV